MPGAQVLTGRAAADNAAWCDLVGQSHGLDTALDGEAWTSRHRTPALYPDAVTLSPTLSVPELLDRIDVSAGCSIKDSFASLDLAAFGFRVLFDAEWIVRPAAPTPTTSPWEIVQDAHGFAAWERAWRGEDGPRDVLRVDLLARDSVTVIAAYDGDRVEAGAILHRSSKVVGVSNVFTRSGDVDAAWAECLGLADSLFRNSVLVGYESGEDLDVALAHGFEAVGPLRVWLHDG